MSINLLRRNNPAFKSSAIFIDCTPTTALVDCGPISTNMFYCELRHKNYGIGPVHINELKFILPVKV